MNETHEQTKPNWNKDTTNIYSLKKKEQTKSIP